MDIATHAGIGIIAAAPVLNSYPELALGLVAGSVFPDLDALSRLFGKRAFLRAHQTWSHALPLQGAASVLAGAVMGAAGLNGWLFGGGLFAGLAFHTLLDFSNTLGVTLFAPFSKKRFCVEWVFFVDAFVLLLTMLTAATSIVLFIGSDNMPAYPALLFFGTLAVYFCLKGWLRKRAGKFASESLTLVPSALCPWRFFGVVTCGRRVSRFQINAISGTKILLTEQEIFDDQYQAVLAGLTEFRLMRGLSPAYHVVSTLPTSAGEIIVCRDLRTRNFKTTFGDLEIRLDANQQIIQTSFHV